MHINIILVCCDESLFIPGILLIIKANRMATYSIVAMNSFQSVSFWSVLLFIVFSMISCCNGEEFNTGDCQNASRTQGFVHGSKPIEKNKYTCLAFLLSTTSNELFCGGTLISTRFVVTSANCLEKKNEINPKQPSEVKVHLGGHNISDATEAKAFLTPEKFFIHEGWNSSEKRYNNDIAMILFGKDVAIGDIKPACLWTSNQTKPAKNDGGFVVGW
jgi:Trypsin